MAFTGVQSGSSLTLTITVLGTPSSWTGTLNGDTLTIEIPQPDGKLKETVFKSASTQQYNQAVDALQQKVSRDDQRYYNGVATASAYQSTQSAQNDQQQAVTDANNRLSNAIQALKQDSSTLASFSETSTLNSYANTWQTRCALRGSVLDGMS